MNHINVIYPYKYGNQWRFDEESKRSYKETLVFGMSEVDIINTTRDFAYKIELK